MARAVLLILFGVAAGFGAAALLVRGGAPSTSDAYSAFLSDDAAGPVRERPENLTVPALFDAKAAALEAAGVLADAFDLERAIEAAAAKPASAARDAEIAALLRRLAETEPRTALQLAERLALGDDTLAMLLQAWATTDADAALAELRVDRPPATQRALALALLETFGVDAAGTERIAALLPQAEARAFTVAAIGKRAEHDLAGALDAAQSFAGATPVAASAVADVAARIDPVLGMELSSRIVGAALRKRYRERLLDEWAKLDPEAMLTYLETADIFEMTLAIYSFEAAAAAAPERLLAAVERFGPSQRAVAQSAAVQALSALDPLTAYNRVRSLPPSNERDAIITRIAVEYVDQDPATALAWAKSLGARSSSALSSVVRRLAAIDPLRATDAVIAEIVDPVAAQRGEMPSLVPIFAGSPDSAALAQIASKVAAYPDARVNRLVPEIMSAWSQSDPRGAADWALRSAAPLAPQVFQNLAAQLATTDAGLATQTASRVPEHLRGPWVVGTVAGIGRSDLAAATAFVGRYRDEAWYDRARYAALQAGAATQPLAVARVIEQEPALASRLAPVVAQAWAANDAPAAASWLARTDGIDESARERAVDSIAVRWAASDLSAATRWVLAMPRGATRDAGLSGLLTGSSAAQTVDAQLFDAFSSARARERAVLGMILTLGRTNPALARSLIAEHVQDPGLRRQAEQELEAVMRPRGNVGGASGSLLTF